LKKLTSSESNAGSAGFRPRDNAPNRLRPKASGQNPLLP